VELRDLIPSKAVQESMELQMSAELARALILTSEGDQSAVNSARGKAEAQILDAEAVKRRPFSKRRLNKDDYPASASRTPAASPQAQATAEALQIAKTLKTDPVLVKLSNSYSPNI